MSDQPPPWEVPALRGRSIRARIVTAFLAAGLTVLAVIAFLLAWQRPVTASLQLVASGYLPLSTQVARLQDDHQRVQRDLTRLSKGRPRPSAGEASAAEIYTEDLRQHIEIARVIAASMRRQASSAEEQAVLTKALAYLDGVQALFERYQQQAQEYVTRAADAPPDSLDELRRPLRATERQLGEELEQLDATVSSRITSLTEAMEQRQARGTALALALALVAGSGMAVLLRAVIRALQPIGRLTEEVGRIAAGDYTGRVDVGGADEVGVLSMAVNSMAQAIASRDHDLQERAEELRGLGDRLTSVLDALRDALYVVEGDRVTLANPAAAGWGVAQGHALPEALRATTEPGLHELLPGDGRRFSARTVPFGPGGVVTILADVTEQHEAQERLARSERLAVVGQMLAQITHEVRNPLNALSLNAELLADEIAALDRDRVTEAGELLAMMSREIERLTGLTRRYLELARRPVPTLEGVDLGGVLRDVVRLLAPEASAAGVELSLDAAPLPPQRVDGDQLRQALHNILRNAVQAGARHIAVGLTVVGDEIHLSVDDDGAGMTEDELRQATDPFFTTRPSGTGIGLAVTRQIVEDHGGSLRMTSEVGRGTAVVMVLPARPAAEVA
ncbi:MAG TPA: ATP-binding protein [Myxococcota bacterium]|nr:ATP-binding protein [Myxococcota bacterium]